MSFKKIQFKYKVNGEEREIALNPYGIIISDKHYIVGFNAYVNDLRLYLVDKIMDLQILDKYFERDENFSLAEYSAKSFGIYQEEPLNIVLEFNKSVAEDILNYHFHPTQNIKELENGNAQVKFTTGGTHAICQELFKWGSDVKIQKPTKLKEHYKKYLQDVINNI